MVTYVKPAGSSVTYVYPTTTFTGAQTAYNNTAATITVGGSTYTVGTGVKTATSTVAVPANSAATNTYYVDQYGFVVASTAAAASTNYAYIVGANGTLTTTIDGSTPAIEVRAVLADGTVGVYKVALTKATADGTVNSVAHAAKDYYVTNLGTLVYVDASKTDNSKSVATGLNGKVYGYTLSGDTITLEPLTAATSSMNASSVYAETVSSVKGGTVALTGSASTTVLVDANTKYVVYNSTDKKATVYTGNNGLSSNTTLSDAKVVLTSSAAAGTKVGTASVIFATGTVSAAATTDYVYIDSSKYTVTMVGATNKNVYTGVKADGSTIELTADKPLTASGLYSYTTDNKVGAALTGAQYITAGSSNKFAVNGSLVSVKVGSDTKYYNITSDTQIVYINSELTEVNDNQGVLVLAVNGTNVTNNVATIYVTAE